MKSKGKRLICTVLSVVMTLFSFQMFGKNVHAEPDTKLAAPTNVHWDGTKAVWDAVPEAEKYSVILFESYNGSPAYYIKAFSSETTSFELFNWLREGECDYIFLVTAIDEDETYVDSKESYSEEKKYNKVLPSLNNVSISADGVATWDSFEGAGVYMFSLGPYGGYTQCPIDLYSSCKNNGFANGTYELIIYAMTGSDRDDYQISATWTGSYTYTNSQYCKISYDANGGKKEAAWIDNREIKENTMFTLYSPSSTVITAPDGKVFAGYEIDGQKYAAGDSIRVKKNITIKYLWKDPIGVAFDINGGTKGTVWLDSMDYPEGYVFEIPYIPLTDTSILQAPAGKIFGGYEINGVEYHPGDTYTLTESTTFKCIWVAPYIITYNINGGTPGPFWTESITVPYMYNYTFPEVESLSIASAPSNQEFYGYVTNDNMYRPGDTYRIYHDVTINIAWKGVDQQVNISVYNLVDGTNSGGSYKVLDGADQIYSGSGKNHKFEYGKTLTFKAQNFGGYQFKGWYQDDPVTGTLLSNDPDWETSFVSDMTVYAVFGKAVCTVTYDANGGTKGSSWVNNSTHDFGEVISLTAPSEDIVKAPSGKTFDGMEINGVKYAAGDSYSVNGSVTCKYIWKDLPTTPAPTGKVPTKAPTVAPTVKPTPAPTDKPTTVPTSAPTSPDSGFGGFVERLYEVALGRPSEPEGKAYWCEHVGNGDLTGAACAREFLTSPEFHGRGLSDEEFLKVLYKAFFDRDAAGDPEGFNFWLNSLKTQGRDRVVEGFIDSNEWCNICAKYGVKSGAATAKATVASSNATAFAERLYTKCLGRDAEADGLKWWSLALTNHEVSGSTAARGFFESKEFVGFGTSNKEYLTRLYRTFMGREPDDDGMNYWLGCMNNGMGRGEVFDRFVDSQEFTEICKSYGIDR